MTFEGSDPPDRGIVTVGEGEDHQDVLVLCYHGVGEHWPTDFCARPEELKRQLAMLMSLGYRGATFHDAVTSPPAERTLAVTFDDAYRSVYEQALPILSQFGLPATVFVPTDRVETGTPMVWPGVDVWLGSSYERELVGMSWHELRELADAGWEIGSHTRTHPYLTQLDDATLADELVVSRETCEQRLQQPCSSLAYPYGDYDDRVVAAAEEAGYRLACTADQLNAPESLRWPRVVVYRRDSGHRFRLKTSPAARKLRSSPVWPQLRRAYRVMTPNRSRVRA
jgi:peptidoglycan/xylan/chitin deacetylase (PgdA/CDA1 family)